MRSLLGLCRSLADAGQHAAADESKQTKRVSQTAHRTCSDASRAWPGATTLLSSGVAAMLTCETGSDPLGVDPSSAASCNACQSAGGFESVGQSG